ncbi:MAG: efflux transporter outer membrane subunit [Dokdonella sp.]|uniref:efflux transporter outer membrane subunit n=3 Tax=Dokdonella sp. TaxID=2291710 RepID=UPI0031CAC6CD|nr:efflux transporter outer membrane subunit [Xanthomonadales bacterium]
MTKATLTTLALAIGLSVAGCASLEPRLPEPAPAIPASLPSPSTTTTTTTAESSSAVPASATVGEVGWRDFFTDARLNEVLAIALANNRDLRVAVLNVEHARAQYRIQRAERLPALGVNAQMERIGADNPALESETYRASLGLSAFELDLFGRVHNLGRSALQHYLASESSQRSAQLALIAEVANRWLSLGADRELLRIAEATLDSYEESLRLTERRQQLGATSELVLYQTRAIVESARSDVARFAGNVAQDINALTLLVGHSVDATLLPDTFEPQISGLGPLPAGLASDVLLRRPDVMAAEHELLAANANIGAARAAFFPSISLTAGIGSISGELSGLFESNSGFWNFVPQINIPVFQGGRLRARLGMATADRDIALAKYEKSIQSGFREVADALALGQSLAAQRSAQTALLDAAQKAHDLSKARYDAGLDSFLVLLDARRTLYAARQSLLATQLAEQANRVTLYKALGGGWQQG